MAAILEFGQDVRVQIQRLATINENPDSTAYIGIRMIMKLATDVSYTTTMKQHNLMIKVALQP